jgi:hypothetical protein
MIVNVRCDCGMRTGVSDALVGKSIRCPQCGENILVTAPAVSPSKKKPAKIRKPELPAVHVSSGTILLLVVFVCGIAATLFFKLGPSRVWREWDQLQPKATDQITDVVSFALQAYLSQHGLYDPTHFNSRPSVNGPINFIEPYMALTLPRKMVFNGKTDQGDFVGSYDTQTGEITAEVAYGGRTFGGLVTLNHATNWFNMTGREVNGVPQAECDGVKLTIYYPPKDQND